MDYYITDSRGFNLNLPNLKVLPGGTLETLSDVFKKETCPRLTPGGKTLFTLSGGSTT